MKPSSAAVSRSSITPSGPKAPPPPPESPPPEVGAVADSTVTGFDAEVVLVPLSSVATAVNLWDPGVTEDVSQDIWYGDCVTGPPMFFPSTRNCTLAIPTLESALAETVTVPETVEFAAGAVMPTDGGDGGGFAA